MMVVGLAGSYGDELSVTIVLQVLPTLENLLKNYRYTVITQEVYTWHILHPEPPLWGRLKNVLKIPKMKKFKIQKSGVTEKINVMVPMDRLKLSEGCQPLGPPGIY